MVSLADASGFWVSEEGGGRLQLLTVRLPTTKSLENAVFEVRSPWLTMPQLVELLTGPLCIGAARRIVLDQLGQRIGRRFEGQWAFVRFAQEQKLEVDLTRPARPLEWLVAG